MSIQLNKKRINCNRNVRYSHLGSRLITSNVEQLGFIWFQFYFLFTHYLNPLKLLQFLFALSYNYKRAILQCLAFSKFSHRTSVLVKFHWPIFIQMNNMIDRNNMIIKIILTIWYQVGPPGFKNQIQPRSPPSIV